MMKRTLQKSRTRVWLSALLITLLLHIVTVVGIWVTRPFAPSPVEAQAPDPVELVFVPQTEAERTDPTQFTELPPDRAAEAPEQADLLSNVDSQARDRVEGGSDQAPRMEGDSDYPQVAMTPTDGEPVPPVPETEAEAESEKTPESSQEEAEAAPIPDPRSTRQNSPLATNQPSPVIKRKQPPPEPKVFQGSSGSDIYQPETANPAGDAGEYGDISLNTWAWDYAPWLQRFRRDFMQNWFAPYAFYMGMIHGWTLVEVEIAKNGDMEILNLLDEEGHESLSEASLAAFRSMAPFRPLPANFPEETLVLTIKLIYPKPRER